METAEDDEAETRAAIAPKPTPKFSYTNGDRPESIRQK